ncbi:Crp/Fnr family transcriptional regulator [Maritimibacter sp. 55A14]|uniref:Crp/Fnr family transcriptional regulator n=1 Tax=Maritimibacter sp. 55A14 TaxID=2174844 RepID=UPI000D60377C|nr:Crp/Fnr family transcriptional regulator [Maritimibacter sp. 55A14]PWE30443.1 Crp/Fnr family transcriptional regulator [Maritimibacter sp. 55A14]
MGWTGRAPALAGFEPETRTRLDTLKPMQVPRGTVLFHPGDSVAGFVVMLAGRVEVFLTGPTGREILLYAVEPGQSCVQSTLGLLGGEDYTGEAIAATDCELVMVPRDIFLALTDTSAAFRHFVFTAFARRVQTMMHLLERIAFQKIEARLATTLLDLAPPDGPLSVTHQDLSVRVGTAREVVSRRLESFRQRGWVRLDRGRITLTDRAALARLAGLDDGFVT